MQVQAQMTAFASPLCLSQTVAFSDAHGLSPRSRPAGPSRRRPARRETPSARVRRGAKPTPVVPATLYDAEPVPDVDFKMFDFSSLRDRVVLVVNVASEDEYTDQNYKSFADLLEKYQAGGFEIVAFPSNWYGQFETGSHEQIKQFVHSTYTDRIKIMAKGDLEWNQVFALARKYFPGEVIWNFHGKFLFGRKGLPVARFDLLTTHEYLESQVSHYVNSPDPSIHEAALPSVDSSKDEEDLYMLQSDMITEEAEEDVVETDEDAERDDDDGDDDAEVDADPNRDADENL